MISNNLRFYSLSEDTTLLKFSENALKKYSRQMSGNPYGYASYLIAADFYIEKPKEILILSSSPGDSDLLKNVYTIFQPNKVVISLGQEKPAAALSASLFQGKKKIDGRTTAYVCHNFACSQPVTDASALQDLIK